MEIAGDGMNLRLFGYRAHRIRRTVAIVDQPRDFRGGQHPAQPLGQPARQSQRAGIIGDVGIALRLGQPQRAKFRRKRIAGMFADNHEPAPGGGVFQPGGIGLGDRCD